MTQFLIIQADIAPKLPLGYKATGIAEVFGDPMSTATTVFGNTEIPAWKISPYAAEIDDLLHAARDAVCEGVALEETELGTLLQVLLREPCEALALFYAPFIDDLPVAASGAQLLTEVREQLDTDDAPEVYVLWRHARQGSPVAEQSRS